MRNIIKVDEGTGHCNFNHLLNLLKDKFQQAV